MKKKKSYAAPVVETVLMDTAYSLLAGSGGQQTSEDAEIEAASLNDFDDTWE